jgi:hypothetical protein
MRHRVNKQESASLLGEISVNGAFDRANNYYRNNWIASQKFVSRSNKKYFNFGYRRIFSPSPDPRYSPVAVRGHVERRHRF